MEFWIEYGLFLAKTLTIVVAIIFVIIMIAANTGRHRQDSKSKGLIVINKINDEIDELKDELRHEILDDDTLKAEEKADKKAKQAEKKATKKAGKHQTDDEENRKRVYVLDFDGDTKASEVEDLRNSITAVLTLARPEKDEVMVRLESPGGEVHSYGLAASQLIRCQKHKIALTICVDKVAASGGYMMACVADNIVAAPFSYIGSIGVLVQQPNIHRLLKDNKIDFEMITAGEYKRTLTTFGENTDKGRAKVKEDVEEMHSLFKNFIEENRPGMDIATVATGEVWTGKQALEKGLIDTLDTSDEWINAACENADVYRISWEQKKQLKDKLSSILEGSISKSIDRTVQRWLHRADKEKFYS